MGAIVTEPAYHVELIGGIEIQKPLPKKFHAIVQARLIVALSKWQEANGITCEVLPELDVLCGRNREDRLIPDITVAPESAHYIDGQLADAALLCVEIMSPGQTIGSLFDKCDRIHLGGTEVCWVVWPERKRCWMYLSNGELAETTVLRFQACSIDTEALFRGM